MAAPLIPLALGAARMAAPAIARAVARRKARRLMRSKGSVLLNKAGSTMRVPKQVGVKGQRPIQVRNPFNAQMTRRVGRPRDFRIIRK